METMDTLMPPPRVEPGPNPGEDARRHAPATARNRGPILEVLRRVLPPTGLVLEIGSGTGEHAAHFAANLPGIVWQPSERDESMHPSIGAWVADSGCRNILPPVMLDVVSIPWSVRRADAIFAANVLHISPYDVTRCLMMEGAAVLDRGGLLILYGPFHRDGRPSAESNASFDRSLRQRDPAWGVRDLEREVAPSARIHGLALREVVDMPANNNLVVFERS